VLAVDEGALSVVMVPGSWGPSPKETYVATHGRTARILDALDEGADTPPKVGKQLGLPTATIRQSLFRLRRAGRVDRSDDGRWGTLPTPDSRQVLDVLSYLESDQRRWGVSELSTCTELTVGQVIVITDVLARRGLIERVSTTHFRAIDPDAPDPLA
jgi:DNA-binding IclR family transcriptional regulator